MTLGGVYWIKNDPPPPLELFRKFLQFCSVTRPSNLVLQSLLDQPGTPIGLASPKRERIL